MTYHNILSNPTLQTSEDALHVEKIHVLDYPPQYIWHPVQWKTTVTPTVRGEYRKRTEDLHVIPTVWPQTVNGTQVLTIEANTKHFVVKLEQFQVPLKAHQRYLVKVLFTPAVVQMGNANPSDLAWRMTLDNRKDEYTDGFQSAASTVEWGQQRSALMVVHSYADQTADLWVEFWSKFGNLDKQIYIHSIEMLEVESAYGEGGSVHYVGVATTEPPDTDPDVDPEPTPVIPTMPSWMVLALGVVGAVIVGVIIYSLLVAPRLNASAVEGTQMEVISITEAGNILMTAIGAILAGGLASPVTTPLVNLIKAVLRVFKVDEEKFNGNVISMIVALGVTIAMWLSRHWGMELQANTVLDWLVVAIPPFVQVISLFAAQKGLFALSQRLDAPVFGYTRS